METAKVDIRKLQLLNDRINQCIDALSQVRLSVHGLTASSGLSHTAPGLYGAPNPGVPYGFAGAQLPFGAQPGIGLSHTGAIGNPYGPGSVGTGVSPNINPFQPVQPFLSANPFGQTPMAGNPFFAQGVPGLSHTGSPWTQGAGFSPYGAGGFSTGGFAGEGMPDPLLTARIAQTFPYAQFPVPPVVSLY